MYAATFEKSGQAVSLAPDEIANDDEISFEISAKTKLTLLIYPQFAAWGFPEKETAVTLFDLGNNSNTIAFYGRVTDVQDSMDTAGRFCRRVTCANEMDFLDDTRTSATFPKDTSTMTLARELINAHNAKVDETRQFSMGTVVQRFTVNAITFDYCTTLEALKKVFVETYGFEIRTRHVNGVNYFDASTDFGEQSETAIVIGDNLQNIRAAYSAADRVVTRLIPLGGTGYDGKRLTIEQAAGNTSGNIYIDNAEMIAKYGIHEGTLIVNELAAQTYSQRAALSQQLYEIGLEEAAALGTPAVSITLSALDLAKIGLDGYTEFALGNTYLTICPKIGIHHDLRVTALKRKLSSPQNTSLTIAAGSRRRAVRVEPLSRQISRYSAYYDDYIGDVDRKQVEMTQKKLDLRLDDLTLKKLTADEYEELKEAGLLDDNTEYFATETDPVTGEEKVTAYLGAANISSEGGGGDDGIPYPGEMIMVVDAVPDGFVGTAQADYMQVSISWEEGGYTTETVDDHTYIVPRASTTTQRTGAVSPSESYLHFVLETSQTTYTVWTCFCEDANGYYLGTIYGTCKLQDVDLLSAANRWSTFLSLPAGTEWIYFVMSKAGSDPVRSESLYYME